MPIIDGAIDQKSFCNLERILYCLLQKKKNIMQMKHLISTKFYLSFSAQIKHNRYSNKINNLKYEQRPHFLQNENLLKSPINVSKVNKLSTNL